MDKKIEFTNYIIKKAIDDKKFKGQCCEDNDSYNNQICLNC